MKLRMIRRVELYAIWDAIKAILNDETRRVDINKNVIVYAVGQNLIRVDVRNIIDAGGNRRDSEPVPKTVPNKEAYDKFADETYNSLFGEEA